MGSASYYSAFLYERGEMYAPIAQKGAPYLFRMKRVNRNKRFLASKGVYSNENKLSSRRPFQPYS
jgi:hypothetical protein